MALQGSMTSSNGYTDEYGTRRLVFSWSATQNIANNTSTINWTLSTSGGYPYWIYYSKTKVVIDGQTVYYVEGKQQVPPGTIATGTITLTHNSVGERSFSASVQAGIYEHAVNCTASGSWALNTIPRGSTVTASGALSFGSQGVLNISRASTGFYDTITYSLGSYSGTIAILANNGALSQNINWTPDANMMNAVPNATSASVVITCKTYSDSAGNTLIATKTTNVSVSIPSSVIPTVSAVLSNSNNTFGQYTQNLSKVLAAITGVGAYSSTVVSYSLLFEDTTYTGNPIETDTIKGSGNNVPVQVKVVDSRGRVGVRTYNINILSYDQPTIECTIHRCTQAGVADEMGAYALVHFEGEVSATASNAVVPSLKMRKVGTSAWTDVTLTNADKTYTGTTKVVVEKVVPADDAYSWEFLAIIEDSANASASAGITISVGYATIDFKAGGKGISFGTTALRDGFICAMDADFTEDLALDGTSIYDIFDSLPNARIRVGTKLYENGQTPTGGDIVIFTFSELDALFGISGTSVSNCIVYAVNGHKDAYNTTVMSVYNKADGIHAIMNPAMTSTNAFRLNYIAIRF